MLFNQYVNYDSNYLNQIDEFLKNETDNWTIPGLKALFQFAWQVYSYALYPYISETGE